MTVEQICDAIINEVQPTTPTALDILQGTVESHSFTAKTANLSLDEAIWRRCNPDKELAKKVYAEIERRFNDAHK